MTWSLGGCWRPCTGSPSTSAWSSRSWTWYEAARLDARWLAAQTLCWDMQDPEGMEFVLMMSEIPPFRVADNPVS